MNIVNKTDRLVPVIFELASEFQMVGRYPHKKGHFSKKDSNEKIKQRLKKSRHKKRDFAVEATI